MKILLLSDCNSVHTLKWARSLSNYGLDIVVFSLGKLKITDYKDTRVKIIDSKSNIRKKGFLSKIWYLGALFNLKKVIKKEQPDIVHAHYATSYGLLGALIGFNPFILSVWGSDIYDFPKKTFLHKTIVKFNLKRADKILSTSKVMAKEIKKYTNKPIDITSFGVDVCKFKPEKVKSLFDSEDIVIGTIKSLEEVYGVSHLIKAFKILVDKNLEYQLKLLLVGGGSLDSALKKLVTDLNLEKRVVFTGQIDISEIPKYHNMIDIFVALSLQESFGVAVLEASACAKPVVVSDADGLKEIVLQNKTGIIVEKENSKLAAEAILYLLENPKVAKKMGEEGRSFVLENYDWNKSLEKMLSVYKSFKN